MAYPLCVLENSADLLKEIVKICADKKIGLIVMGESKNFKMEDNAVMSDIRNFGLNLQKSVSIPIEYYPEFMTSEQAERIQGKNKMLDASAAAIILQGYLDRSHLKS